jgi:hypothetical protein
VTIDEELALLEDHVRRLKVEYDMYFGGGLRRAPADLDWRVQSLIKKYTDTQKKLNSSQRFKYNGAVQRYAVYSDLWRQKLRIKEEGYRRPQDALLGIQGLRFETDNPSVAPAKRSVVLSFTDSPELEGIQELYEAMQSGAGGGAPASLEALTAFLRTKTKAIQNTYGCSAVKYTVEVKDGRVRIKAAPKP